MRRAGGYSTYWSAYNRLLLESARPMDALWAGLLPPGIHDVEIDEVEHGWSFVRLRCAARAGRRVWMRLGPDDPRTHEICRHVDRCIPAPGDWGRMAAALLGARARVSVEHVGDVDVLICADRTYVLVGAADRAVRAQCNSQREMDEWLSKTGATRVRPRVMSILSLHLRD